ncbi:MAG TPA: hypothetical protein VI408_08360 [Gaiellaceae bacterium]
MTIAFGLALSLASAFALNWGWIAQHGATNALPPLSLRRPVRSLRSLFGDRSWLVGFGVGILGWALYIAALALAPLSLVQAVSAGGIGILAGLAHRRGEHVRWWGVAAAVAGLALLAISLAGGAAAAHHPAPADVAVWLVAGAAAAAAVGGFRSGAALGLAAGVLYGSGDVATKAATFGGLWLVLVAVLLAAHGAAFVVLQLGFQRGGALATAGVATLVTNALPIAAGLALFHEHLPGGALGALRVLAFALVVVGATTLAREGEASDHAAILAHVD